MITESNKCFKSIVLDAIKRRRQEIRFVITFISPSFHIRHDSSAVHFDGGHVIRIRIGVFRHRKFRYQLIFEISDEWLQVRFRVNERTTSPEIAITLRMEVFAQFSLELSVSVSAWPQLTYWVRVKTSVAKLALS